MKKEMITLQFGQCGNQLGTVFWETLANEHGLTMEGEFRGDVIQQSNIDLYFQESNALYSPRCILIDLERAVINNIKSRGHFYNDINCVVGNKSASNCFAVGFNEEFGIRETVKETVRKELEHCSNLTNFSFIHSASGGVSGFAMKVCEMIWEDFKKQSQCYSIYPDKDLSYSCTEAYNTLLCSNELIKHMDAIYVFDNQTLCNTCTNILGKEEATFRDFNQLISFFLTTLTSPTRFPTQVSIRPKKLLNILQPEKSLKFFIPSIAPLQSKRIVTPKSLVSEIFSNRNFLCQYSDDSLIINSAIIFRGCQSTLAYDEELQKYYEGNVDKFTEWMPSNLIASYCDLPLFEFSPQTACRVTVSDAINVTLQQVVDKAQKMLSSGFGLFWYTDNGCGEDMFQEALEIHGNLIDRYAEVSGNTEDSNKKKR